jgi:myo-inositol 2-dehydrogenase / D-chiro-inositol 1-dehydrogenase
MTNLAICGAGRIGTVHLENLRTFRGCRVVGLYDLDADRAASLAKRNGIRSYESFDDVLTDQEIHAVVIATSSSSHCELTLRALAAGKHVFVEKPLADTIESSRAIVDAAQNSGLVVQVGFCERFNPHYMEARTGVQTGRLGKIRAIYSSRIAPYEWCDPSWSLGVLDTAVHNIDLALWILRMKPLDVLARGTNLYPDSDMLHSVTTLLRFPNGVVVEDQTMWLRVAKHPLRQCSRSRMLLLGDAGSFEVDLNSRLASALTTERFEMCDTVILGGEGYYGCLKLQFEFFLRSIEERVPVVAPVDDALLAETVILAAQESLRTGREVAL